jgi:RNA polymerase sigma factor (sigma-70 family)
MAAVMEDTRQALVERLFAGYAGVLRAFLRRRIGLQPDTEELCQEVFFRMLRIPEERVILNPERYLFVVARNLVHEYRQAHARRNEVDIDDPQVDQQTAELPSFGNEVDNAQRIRRLGEVLHQLSPKCQAVVALRFWQEQSYEDIAQQLGISTNMVKKYLSQALVHCRRRMQRLG